MKAFVKNFFAAIPFALGVLLTLFSIVHAMEADRGDNWVPALIFGLIGIPMLFAAIIALAKD